MNMNQGLLATANHEAGHVVIAEMLWIKTLGASIVPDKDTWGHVFMARFPKSIRLDSDISPGVRNRIDRRIMVSLAGCLAEQKFTGKKKPNGAERDHRNAIDLADCLTGSIEETNAYIAWLLIRTCAAVELYYPIIEAVAANLYEYRTLTGNQLRECIRIARDKMVREEPLAA